jgi:hypothetical protein
MGIVSFEEVHLMDVQGLFGGQNLYIRSDGRFFSQLVRHSSGGLIDRRFKGVLEAEEIGRLSGLLESVDFENLTIPDRQGVPDEARPIIVVFKEGRVISKSKWANDFHEGFDRVYSFLKRIGRVQEESPPHFKGKYDRLFLPKGFRNSE